MKYDENKVGKIENKYGSILFRTGLGYMIDKGMDFCSNLVDEDIEQVKGNAMMTAEFVQDMIRCAKELSQLSLWEDIIPYIKEHVSVYGCEDYKEKSNRMLTIAYNAICLGQLDEIYDRDDLLCELGCTEEEYEEIME